MLPIKEKFDFLMASINKLQQDNYFNKLSDENKETISKMVLELFYNADNKSYKLDVLFLKLKKELKKLKMTQNEFNEFEQCLKKHLEEIQNLLFELSENGVRFELKSIRGEMVLTVISGTTILGSITLVYFFGPLLLVSLATSAVLFVSSVKSLRKLIKKNKKLEEYFGKVLASKSDVETNGPEENSVPSPPPPPPPPPASPKIVPIPDSQPKSKKVCQPNKSKEEELMNAIRKLRSELPEYLTDEEREKYNALTSRAERNNYLLEIKKKHEAKGRVKVITKTEMIASRKKVLENKGIAPEDAPEEIKEEWNAMSFQERMKIVSDYSTKTTSPDPNKVPIPENISEEDKNKWDSLSWLERAEMWCRYDSYGPKSKDTSK